MGLREQLIVIVGMFILAYPYFRSVAYGIKRYQLNNSAYKKRKKEESLIDRLLYIKFREEIPKIILVLNIILLLIHPLASLICVIAYFVKATFVGIIVAYAMVVFDLLWMLIIALLFWTPRRGGYPYERWIKKKHGQYKKK